MSDSDTPKPTALVVDEDDARRSGIARALSGAFAVRSAADIADAPDRGFVVAVHSARQLERLAELQQTDALSEEIREDRRLLAEARRALRRQQERMAELQERLDQAEDRLRRLVGTDPATGLYNRRYFKAAWRRDITRARRYGEEHAVLIIHVDVGAGPSAMQDVGRRLMMSLRAVDVVARWGEREFVVSLPRTGKAPATLLGERLRADIAAQNFGDAVTATLGVGAFPDDGDAPGAIVARARRAMLRGVAAGGNRALAVGPEDADDDESSFFESGEVEVVEDGE